MLLCAYKDVTVGKFSAPFMFDTVERFKGATKEMLEDRTQFNSIQNEVEDLQLFVLGTYEPETGFLSMDGAEYLCDCASLVLPGRLKTLRFIRDEMYLPIDRKTSLPCSKKKVKTMVKEKKEAVSDEV